MPEKLAFLTSSRFWQFAVAIALFVLLDNGVFTSENLATVLEIVALLSATSATVGTVDRFSEYMGS